MPNPEININVETGSPHVTEVQVGAPYQVDIALTSTNVRPLWRHAWNIGTFYNKYNMVEFDGSAWIAIDANVGQQPDLTPLSWELFAAKGDNAVGTTDAYFRHVQGSASATWTVTHNLNKRPSVTVTDSAGTVVYGAIEYINENSLRVLFSAAFSGELLCS